MNLHVKRDILTYKLFWYMKNSRFLGKLKIRDKTLRNLNAKLCPKWLKTWKWPYSGVKITYKTKSNHFSGDWFWNFKTSRINENKPCSCRFWSRGSHVKSKWKGFPTVESLKTFKFGKTHLIFFLFSTLTAWRKFTLDYKLHRRRRWLMIFRIFAFFNKRCPDALRQWNSPK